MEIILLEPVKKLGNVGDVVRVRNGFARNFLIPGKKAIRATESNRKLFEARKADIEKDNAKKLAEAEKIAKKVNGAIFTVIRQAGDDGRLYGSVTAKDISDGLNAAGHESVDRRQVVLNTPIKYIGIYTIELQLHGDVVATVHPNVSRSEDESVGAKARFERGEVVMEGQGTEKKSAEQPQEVQNAAEVGENPAAPVEGEQPQEKKKASKKTKQAKAPKESDDASAA